MIRDSALLLAEETADYCLRITLNRDRTECVATCEGKTAVPATVTPPQEEAQELLQGAGEGEKPGLSADRLAGQLRAHRIDDCLDLSALEAFCAEINHQRLPARAVIARGKHPQPGDDGWFELLVKVSGDEVEFSVDDKGRADLKTLNAYTEIEPEQKLGIIHPAQAGEAGFTVQGEPIAAAEGRPVTLVAGEGVELKYGGRIAFSTRAGRALFEKNVLTVVEQLVIPGNIDLRVGHVDFHGYVEIKGDVLDDFDVRSTKGIKVGGHVGACHLESRGSIEVGSMAGKEIGRILCQGDVRAKFLNQVTVICYGNVIVSNEIRNCDIKATGHIVVERGGIIGGSCVALKGVSAAVIGAVSGQKTQVAAGIYFPDNDRFSYLTEHLKKVQQQIISIGVTIDSLKKHLHKDDELALTAQTRLKLLNDKLDQLYAQKNAFSAEIAASQPQQMEIKNPKINVQKTLQEGVIIILGRVREEIHRPRSGPLTLIENTRQGGLRYLRQSPLTVTAMEIEKQLLAAEDAGDPMLHPDD